MIGHGWKRGARPMLNLPKQDMAWRIETSKSSSRTHHRVGRRRGSVRSYTKTSWSQHTHPVALDAEKRRGKAPPDYRRLTIFLLAKLKRKSISF